MTKEFFCYGRTSFIMSHRDTKKMADSHFTANGVFGKVSQQTRKVSQQSRKVSQQSGKVSQQFVKIKRIFSNPL